MANYDPAKRVETWLFQRLGVDDQKKPVYRRLKYNLVSYDGSPERVLEPLAPSSLADITGNGTVIDPMAHFGRVGGFEYFNGRPFEVFSIDDTDAAVSGAI